MHPEGIKKILILKQHQIKETISPEVKHAVDDVETKHKDSVVSE